MAISRPYLVIAQDAQPKESELASQLDCVSWLPVMFLPCLPGLVGTTALQKVKLLLFPDTPATQSMFDALVAVYHTGGWHQRVTQMSLSTTMYSVYKTYIV